MAKSPIQHHLLPVLMLVVAVCMMGGCVPANAPETHRIPLKEELESQGSAQAPSYQSAPAEPSEETLAVKVTGDVHLLVYGLVQYQSAIKDGYAAAHGEKPSDNASQSGTQQTQDNKPKNETTNEQESQKPGKAYIDATSAEDRAIAAKAASAYITGQTDSRLDKLLLTPDDTYHFWRVPEYLKAYDKPGSVLIFEAYCNNQKTPDAVLLIKEADHVWTVKIFNTQKEYDGLFKQ